MGAPYIYDISRLRVKDLHSATYIYVVRRLRVNPHVVFIGIIVVKLCEVSTNSENAALDLQNNA